MEKKLPWKRFVCPTTSTYTADQDGFLVDPDQKYGESLQPHLKSVSQLRSMRCVCILGEPGIGKSNVLSDLAAQTEEIISETDTIIKRNLNEYSSDSLLVSDIFEDLNLLKWQNGLGDLYLFLDSIDECQLRIQTVFRLLHGRLSRLPKGRLYLRLSCRTGVWSHNFQNDLARMFNEEFYVCEVVPLRRDDVTLACQSIGVTPDQFVAAVIARDVVPFAVRPITLKFLIQLFKDKSGLPNSQNELYLDGCINLCLENDPARKDQKRKNQLSAEEKLIIASRIAAMMILTNKNAIWLGADSEKTEFDISIKEIIGGSSPEEQNVQINEHTIRETLDSGLFASRGTNRLGWAHQTYSEFLTAHYLTLKRLPNEKLEKLFLGSSATDPKVVPQLQQAAVFLASINRPFFNIILKSDPEVLLRCDSSSFSDVERAKIIENVLLDVESGKSAIHSDFEIRSRFSRLKHPHLASQLKPFIANRKLTEYTNQLAIDIAELCDETSLSETILNQALDVTQPYQLRVNATVAIKKIGSDEDHKKLVPLLSDKQDKDDQLKGYALAALWPKHIKIENVLELLKPIKRDHFYGAFASFFQNDFIPHISNDQMKTALAWANENLSEDSVLSKVGQTVDRLISHAWDKVDEVNLYPDLAKIAFNKSKLHQSLVQRFESKEFQVDFLAKVEKRRKLFLTVFNEVPSQEIEPFFLIGSATPLLTKADFGWLLSLIEQEKDKSKVEKLIGCSRYIYDWSDNQQTDALFYASRNVQALQEHFRWSLGPIDLTGDDAKEMKSRFQWEKEFEEKKETRKIEPNRILGFLTQNLNSYENGDENGFINLVFNITANLETGLCETDSDIIETQMWDVIDLGLKGRILESGKRYLKQVTPDLTSYFESNSLRYDIWSGIKMLRLLYVVDRDYLDKQSSELWIKWAAAILIFPPFGSAKDDASNYLESKVITKAHVQFEKTLVALATKEAKSQKSIYITDKYKDHLTPNLFKALLQVSTSLNLEAKLSVLGKLLSYGRDEAENELLTFISVPLPTETGGRKTIITAASELVQNSPTGAWEEIWPLIKNDREFGRELILSVASSYNFENSIVTKLNEYQIGEFYKWMVKEFPYTGDSGSGGLVGPEERAEHLRDGLMRSLVNRGTNLAVEVIQKIVTELPKYNFLQFYLIDARKRLRLVEWQPLKTMELLEFVDKKDKTLVRNENDLVEVILRSLKRFEETLKGTPPALPHIWNTEKNRFMPKEENEVSDTLKIHLDFELKKNGIIVNREVEIRPSYGKNTGQETDLKVDVSIEKPGGLKDVTSVILETKGCWHKEVFTAVETQLAERYLKGNDTKHGIYLVCSFQCQKWSDEDHSRKEQSRRNNVDTKFGEIAQRANDLKDRGYYIFPLLLNCKYDY